MKVTIKNSLVPSIDATNPATVPSIDSLAAQAESLSLTPSIQTATLVQAPTVPTISVTPVKKERKPLPNAKDPAHLAKMLAGRKAKAEARRAEKERLKQELAKTMAEQRLAAELDRVRAKFEQRSTEPRTYQNAIHAAFNYHLGFKGGNSFIELATFECDSAKYKAWFEKIYPGIQFVEVEGFDYSIVLMSRKAKQFVVLFASLGTIHVCGYSPTVSDELWAEINMLSGGIPMVKV